MNKSLKGALLSGLVFPGTGQVALGRRGRGFFMIAAALAGLVVIVARVTQHAQAVIDQMLAQGSDLSLSAITEVTNHSVSASENLFLNIIIGAVTLIWIFSIIDAWIIGKSVDTSYGTDVPARSFFETLYDRLKNFIRRFKELNGNPHYIALGMAIGVFVSFTPTIPFHTVIGVFLAFLFKGSKSAAAIAVWLSNPVTVPLFYYAEYQTGCLLLGRSIPFNKGFESITTLLKLGWDATMVMMVGGALLGIIAAIITYFVTRRLAATLHVKKQAARGL